MHRRCEAKADASKYARDYRPDAVRNGKKNFVSDLACTIGPTSDMMRILSIRLHRVNLTNADRALRTVWRRIYPSGLRPRLCWILRLALCIRTHLFFPFFPPSPASSAADPTADARGGGGGAAPSAADTRGGGGGAIGGEPSLTTA